MTGEQRLTFIVSALETVGISCLIMGGHAVRFYGIARNTDDFDLHIAANAWEDLVQRLAASQLFPNGKVVEGESWRVDAFRRFRLGALADGRDEWLEFWKQNHLLGPFDSLMLRAETGNYGGRHLKFLGLDDLIRSKETERDKDWRDVTELERVLDSRSLAKIAAGHLSLEAGLALLRSRSGFEAFAQKGWFQTEAVTAALATTAMPITQSYLIPFAPKAPRPEPEFPIEPILVDRLEHTAGGSALHMSLVEIVRRRYVLLRKEYDRLDKEKARQKNV